MLNLILGRAGFGKTYYIQNLLLQKLKNKEENLILIVPHENIFDNEKAILNLVGEKLNSAIKIMSFKTLSEFVFEKIGKYNEKKINNIEKTILMSLAIDAVKEKLVLYKNFSEKPEFINFMISALNELKSNNINTDTIFKIEAKLKIGSLKNKLREIALILKTYDSFLNNTYLDPLDDLNRLCDFTSQTKFFNDYTVIIDGFFKFSIQELSVIEVILKQSKETFISICTDNDCNKDLDIFSISNQTVSTILNIAKKNNVKINEPLLLTDSYRFKNKELTNLEATLCGIKNQFNEVPNNIVIYKAKDTYDEANFIAKSIKTLILEKGYRYSDFSIITFNKEIYNDTLKIFLSKREIPCFVKEKNSCQSPLINLVLSAFDVVNTNFSSNVIFKYLKTGLTNFSIDEISSLENYITLCGIYKIDWTKDFILNPIKLYENANEPGTKILKDLNVLRENIIEPLLNFGNEIKNTNVKNITKATYEFLEKINACQNLKILIENLSEGRYTDLADNLENSWDFLIDTFDQIVSLLGDKPMSPQKYKDLLKILLISYPGNAFVKKLDEVSIKTINETDIGSSKVLFLCGCTDKNFPISSKLSNVFTTEEIEKMNDLIPELFESLRERILKEQFLLYKALTSSQEKLYLSLSDSLQTSEPNLPSEFIEKICCIFPKLEILDNCSFNIDDEIFSEKDVFDLYAKLAKEKSLFSETLKYCLSAKQNYIGKIKNLEKLTLNKPIHFENSQTAKNLFSKNLKFSATQIEKYYLCPFQFFCRYELYAKPIRPIKFDALEYGKLMHFILEKILSKYKVLEILAFPKKELEHKMQELLEIYVKKNLLALSFENLRTKYLFSNIIKTALPLVIHIASELSQSEFIPTDFELSISEKSKIKPLALHLPDKTCVKVSGKIDRVDIMKKNSKKYIRVVDYKTGTKEFKLFDVLYGLNIQMLIYLLAILKNDMIEKGENIPAGVLYMPAQKPTVSANRDIPDSKIKDQKSRKLRMNGLVLNSPEIIYGMEKEAKGEFIPVTVKEGKLQKSDSLVNTFEMQSLLNYLETLVISMAMSLKSGKISPMPAKGELDACTYCEYSSVCGFTDGHNSREIKKVERSLIFDEILKEKEKINSCLLASGPRPKQLP